MPTSANQVCGRPSYRRNLTPCQFVRINAVRGDGRVKVIRGRTQLVEGEDSEALYRWKHWQY